MIHWGIISPILVKSKILLSDNNKINPGWDSEVDPEILSKWQKVVTDNEGCALAVPRAVTTQEAGAIHSLVAFADASAKAYGICIYVRTIYTNGEITCRLLTSKARVVSKEITIPRSELVALGLAVRMTKTVVCEMDLVFKNVYVFTDSMIALHWVKKSEKTKTFVANRVKEVRELLVDLADDRQVECLHVRTDENPADATTRGLTIQEMSDHIWWEGPTWLKQARVDWPASCNNFELEADEEEKVAEEVTTIVTMLQLDSGLEETAVPFHCT